MSSLLTYNFQILMSLMMLSMVFVMITMAEESAKRIVEVLTEESSLKNPENPVMDVKDGSIDFDNVSFKYSKTADRMALKDINLHIKSGEVIGIIGGTGSSKSTLIQLISRLYDVTEGTVKVGGVDVRSTTWRCCATRWPWCSRRTCCSPAPSRTTCAGVTRTPRRGDGGGLQLAQADEFVQQFPDKYDTYIEQGGTNVSGGQKQRLCIARPC